MCTITSVLWLAGRLDPWQDIGSAGTVTAVKCVSDMVAAGETQPWNPYWTGFTGVESVSEVSETTYSAVESWILKYCHLMVFLSSLLLCLSLQCMRSGETLVKVCREDFSLFGCYCVIRRVKAVLAVQLLDLCNCCDCCCRSRYVLLWSCIAQDLLKTTTEQPPCSTTVPPAVRAFGNALARWYGWKHHEKDQFPKR